MEGIQIYCLPQLPCQLYVEGPSLRLVQHLITYSQSTYHGGGICVIDDVDRKWLQGNNISLSLPCATWVKITECGLYSNDLALVVESPSQGDIVTLVVVPRFSQNEKKRKQKGMRPSPVHLDAESLARLPFKENFYRSGSRRFHSSGLEFLLAPAAHAVKVENNPPKEQLRLSEQSISLQQNNLNWLLLDAIKLAYYQKVQDTWHIGDRMQICSREFIGWQGYLVKIKSSSQCALVLVYGPQSLEPIRVHIPLANLEQYFEIGDVIRVVIGMEKGWKGSIISIENEAATILLELSSEAGEFFVEVIVFFPFFPFV